MNSLEIIGILQNNLKHKENEIKVMETNHMKEVHELMQKLQDVRSGDTGKSLQAADRNVSSWMPVCREFSRDIFHMTEVSVRTL